MTGLFFLVLWPPEIAQIAQIKGTLDCSSVGSLSHLCHGIPRVPEIMILKGIPGIVTIFGFRISKKFSSLSK